MFKHYNDFIDFKDYKGFKYFKDFNFKDVREFEKLKELGLQYFKISNKFEISKISHISKFP